jgi:hypothetical protein
MKTHIQYSIIIIYFLTVLFACSENDVKVDPTAGLTKIGESYALGAGTKTELWAKEDLFTGYNNLFVALYDSITNEQIVESHVHLTPTMTMMGGMQHSCPVINPESEDAANGLFPAVSVFTMPSGEMGTWSIQIRVHNHVNEKFGNANFPVDVKNPATPRMKSFQTESGRKIFVSYNFPDATKIGINDIEVAVFEMANGFEFPLVEDYQISLEPEMPSMEHGSPNNVNPTVDTDGLYRGKVNFTMSGDWRLHLTIRRGDDAPQSFYFDVNVD